MNEKKTAILFISILSLTILMLSCTNPSGANPAGSGVGASKVDMPLITPDSGTVTEFDEISISIPAGSSVYFTTDGTDPIEDPALEYSVPFTLSYDALPQTVKALAVLDGLSDSDIVSEEFVVTQKVSNVVFADPTGAIPDNRDIALSTATAGATIYFTVDGSDPTADPALEYSAPFTMAGQGLDSINIRAFAVFAGYSDSNITDVSYTKSQVSTPVSDQVEGSTISETMVVTLSTDSVGAAIYFTTDGSDPSVDPALEYTAPFTMPVGVVTVKSMAVLAGYSDSDIATLNLTVEAQAEVPAISLDSGFTAAGSTVTLSTASGLETIYYTLDGSDPTISGIEYSAPVALSISGTLRTYAAGAGYYPSIENTADYKVYESVDTLATDTGALIAVAADGTTRVRAGGTYYSLTAGSLGTLAVAGEPAGIVQDFVLDAAGGIHALYLAGTDLIYWTSDSGPIATVNTTAVNLADARILMDSSGNVRVVFTQNLDGTVDQIVETVYSSVGALIYTSSYDLDALASGRSLGLDAALNSSGIMNIAVSYPAGTKTKTSVVSYDSVLATWTDILINQNNAGNPAIVVEADGSLLMPYVRVDKSWFMIYDIETTASYKITTFSTAISGDTNAVLDSDGNLYATSSGYAWIYDGTSETTFPAGSGPYRLTADDSGNADPYIVDTAELNLYAIR